MSDPASKLEVVSRPSVISERMLTTCRPMKKANVEAAVIP